ncbi:ROK family protein [Candidatus Enterococcus willemsii]|uniref:ROK family protein n=1 Tax=Candidatus Enterococcus willemsii TaxID=1857215 RepID=A0ABQ6YY54_9ENTE|nr:ROK family protein [Enterococcus sp. CU12B]KAF1303008.1 hypothetical protein BAU17_07710 [Enterococcus sp. CU12B]
MKLVTIDIGGTYIKFGSYDCHTNKLAYLDTSLTPQNNQQELLSQLVNIVNRFSDVSGCAISIPGTIDVERGYVVQGGALQYNNNTYFADKLSEKIGIPVIIENDARCAAYAELWQGKLKGIKNALVLVVGTGLGCAIIQNGKIYRGTHLYAGEFSLIFTKSINQFGFDAVLGNQVGIPKFVSKMSSIYGEEIDGPRVFQLIEDGERQLSNCFDEYVNNFATQLFNFQIMLDPEKILIGGGISQNELYMNKLSQAVEKFYQKIPIAITHSPIEACQFKSEANLIGAVRNYMLTKT